MERPHFADLHNMMTAVRAATAQGPDEFAVVDWYALSLMFRGGGTAAWEVWKAGFLPQPPAATD